MNNFSTHYYSILFLSNKRREKNFQIDEIEMTPVECAQKWQKHIKIQQGREIGMRQKKINL